MIDPGYYWPSTQAALILKKKTPPCFVGICVPFFPEWHKWTKIKKNEIFSAGVAVGGESTFVALEIRVAGIGNLAVFSIRAFPW